MGMNPARSTSIRLYDITVGTIIGGVLGFVMAQTFDLLYAIMVGVIMGGFVAYGSSSRSKPKEEHLKP